MQDPKIISTKTVRPAETQRHRRTSEFGSAIPGALSSDAAAVPRGPSPWAARRPFYAHPAVLGLLFVAAGGIVWSTLTEKTVKVPATWQESRGTSAPAEGMSASIRPAGPGQGDLLRLEWPAHPKAESYLVRFDGANGFKASPIPVLGSVFLYDLKSNVFGLPDTFRWSVTAVMSDGEEVATPPSNYTLVKPVRAKP